MSAGTPLQPTHHTIDGELIPTLDDIAAQHFALAPWVLRTPVFDRHDFGTLDSTLVNFKFELLQAGGSFKTRGAFTHLLALDPAERRAGVTCVSGGNHAIAVAYAAMRLGISAKVVLFHTASAARVAQCRRYRAEIVMARNAREAFDIVRRIEAEEGRYFVHP
ncbi:MAG TPA: pyridoxal-phosphate dependent enzyme, partial [Paraburkholderia sp.]